MVQPRRLQRSWIERMRAVGTKAAFGGGSAFRGTSGGGGGTRAPTTRIIALLSVMAIVLCLLLAINYRFVIHIKLKRTDSSPLATAPSSPSKLRSTSSVTSTTTTTTTRIRRSPPYCTQLLREKQNHKLRFVDPNEGLDRSNYLIHVKRFEPTSSFWMAVHSNSTGHQDPTSQSIKSPTYKEGSMEEIWKNVLLQGDSSRPNRSTIVIDVGAGIGYYSLLARAIHPNVILHVFEPNPVHNLRLCESMEANGWVNCSNFDPNSLVQGDTPIYLHSEGLSDQDTHVAYRLPRSDPLLAAFDGPSKVSQPRKSNRFDRDWTYKSVTTLDSYANSMNWFPNRPLHQAVRIEDQTPITALRINVEDMAPQIIWGAQTMLLHHLVENIFLTVSARTNVNAANAMVGLSLILDAGYKLVGYGSVAQGPSEEVVWLHDATMVGNIVSEAQHQPNRLLSVWFQFPMNYNKAYQEMTGNFLQSKPLQSIPTILHCPKFLSEVDNGKLGIEDPNIGRDAQYHRQFVNESHPSFWISLHNEQYDRTRWQIKTSGHYYKTQLEQIWRNVLTQAPPDAIILDVGSNIGYFSLLSLAMGDEFEVYALEPNSVNFVRLCESLEWNHWTTTTSQKKKIHLYPVGVSDTDGVMPFVVDADNPGASHFLDTIEGYTKPYVKTPVIALDSLATLQGWFDAKRTIVILKIDVEGMEHRVLAGAHQLLQRHMVQNVFLEVSVKDEVESNHTIMALTTLLQAKYQLVGQGSWQGPGQPVPWSHDANLISNVVAAAQAQDSKQLNVWFQPRQR